jgi:hypothetical protein
MVYSYFKLAATTQLQATQLQATQLQATPLVATIVFKNV